MHTVVADTGPILYPVLIGHAEILPALFEKVIIPSAVRDELSRGEAPEMVRNWIQTPPAWLELRAPPTGPFDHALEKLDDGEKAALALAAALGADLVLLDDREGVRVARNMGLRAIGTLRVLQLARAPWTPGPRRFLPADEAHEFPLSSGDYGRAPQ